MVVYVSRGVLLIGVILIVLAAFDVSPPGIGLFALGVAVCFAAGLVP